MPKKTVSLGREPQLGLGLNFSGAQLRYRLRSPWVVEGRWQRGTSSSNYGTVTANTYGVRGYRRFCEADRYFLYAGSELSRVSVHADNWSGKVNGTAAGGFAGAERRVAKNLSLAIDIGPYVMAMRESHTSASDTSLDFMLNTGLVWYLF